MVRVNLVHPKKLADQHLIAEYNELLMLTGYVKKHPDSKYIPEAYVLGKGHMRFFKNKLGYIKKRHEQLKKEMHRRGFKAKKTIRMFNKALFNDWKPLPKDIFIIKQRLREKIGKKPSFYRYYGKRERREFFLSLLK